MPVDNEAATGAEIVVVGDDVLGIKVVDVSAGQMLATQLRQAGGWLDVVAGIDSVAVHFDLAEINIDGARRQLREQLGEPVVAHAEAAALVEIPVCYGGDFGPDLEAVCERLDLSAERLIDLHSSPEYRVEMLGFTPGFAYIGGLSDKLNVPRLEQPRQQVAAGSVGIAGGRSGVYAMTGPGGWPLIGRTPMRLFDASAEEPFRLSAGSRVRFVAIDPDQFQALEQS